MCVIIVKKPTDVLTAEDFQLFANGNRDGWGFCYNDHEGVPQSFRGMTLPELNAVAGAMDGREAVIHFRLSTHGKKNAENCHPYEVIPGLYLLHNGIFTIDCDLDKDMSDTWHFGETLIKPLVLFVPEADRPAYIRTAAFRCAIEEMAGGYNKVVLFDREGTVIYNRSAWVEKAGPKDLLMSNSGPYWGSRASSRTTKDYDNYGTGDTGFFPHWAERTDIIQKAKSDSAIIVYDKNGVERTGGESAIYGKELTERLHAAGYEVRGGAVVEEITEDAEEAFIDFCDSMEYDELTDPDWLRMDVITGDHVGMFVEHYPREAAECLVKLLNEGYVRENASELIDDEALIAAYN